ncbi:MAG TPA: hypothetical protein VFY29_00945, partial [Terriglobia bacterium]|nr:hypothetical protein [Terriglobia bacterium]
SGSYVYPLLDNGENAWGAWEGNAAPIVPPAKALPNPFYFVAVCSDSLEIDRIDLSSAYLEGAEDTLSDWEQARIGATANPAGPVRREEIGAGPNFAEVDDLLAKLEKARLEKAQETLARRRSLHTLYRQSTGLFRTRVRHAAELRRLRDEASLLKTQLRETTRELEGYRRRWLDLEARASRPILRIFWDRVAARLPWLHRQEKSAAEPAAPLTADAAPSPSPYPEDTVGPMRGYLDYPREGESVFGTTAICGWVHSTAGPIVGIEVSIGDTVLGSIAHGTARPDVTAKLPDQPRASGFQGKVFISGHEPEGDAQLRIRASDAAGNVWVFTRELRIGYDAKLRGMLDPVADAGLGSAVGSTFIEISGWSFSVAAVTTVEAWIDDLYLGALHYGVARPDVVTSFPEAPLACGFRDTLFIGDLQLRGKKTLKVEIADADGNEARYTRAIIFPSPARWSAA